MKKPVIFYDLETTGMPTPNVKIIEICAIKVDIDTLEEIDRIYYKCNNDGTPIDKEATERHGIVESDLVGLPTFNEVANEVFNFFQGCDLGGYYCTFFDIPILYSSFLRANLTWDFRKLEIYDIHTLYKKYNSGKLKDVYKHYTGKDLDNAHEAESDIKATIEIYKELRKRDEEFEPDELMAFDDFLDISGNFKIRKNNEGKKEIYLTFGKYKNKSIDEIDDGYFKWMMNDTQGFPVDTKYYANKILEMKNKS